MKVRHIGNITILKDGKTYINGDEFQVTRDLFTRLKPYVIPLDDEDDETESELENMEPAEETGKEPKKEEGTKPTRKTGGR